jgi:CRP/FNR family cyclic AMP-dependent transcriptional regulator
MTPLAAAKKRRRFHLQTFLSTIDGGRTIATFTKKQTIIAPSESADSVFYIERERVKLTALLASGKEGTIGILNERAFFGEGCLTG